MVKLVVNSRMEDKDLPPNLSVGSFDPEEHGVATEGDMVRQVFIEAGPGEYNIFCSFEGEAKWRRLWSGEIRVEGENLLYKADRNDLDTMVSIAVPKRPKTGVLKKVERPKKAPESDRF